MAKTFIMMIAMLIGSSMSHEEEKGGGVIYVNGKVLCQDCTQGWNEWVHGSKPIKGAIVSVTCMDRRKRVIFFGSDECDETGAYEIKIKKYINGKKLEPTNCSVRLVSSPDRVCNIATNFSGGQSGVMLNTANKFYKDIVKYEQKPFYYTTPMCEDPDTNYD